MITSYLLGAVELGGKGMINDLITFLLVTLCVCIVYAIGWYFFKDPPCPPITMKIWNGLFILIGGLAIVNFFLGLGGHQFIAW